MKNDISDLMQEFEMLSLTNSDKITLNKLKNTINTSIEKTKYTQTIVNEIDSLDNNDNINEIISQFSQLEISTHPKIINKFYNFLLKLMKRDMKIINSTLFVPPEPPFCR